MREKYSKATLSKVEVEDMYLYEVKATIDDPNKLITIDTIHVNKLNKYDNRKSVTISFEDLESLKNVIRQLEALEEAEK